MKSDMPIYKVQGAIQFLMDYQQAVEQQKKELTDGYIKYEEFNSHHQKVGNLIATIRTIQTVVKPLNDLVSEYEAAKEVIDDQK